MKKSLLCSLLILGLILGAGFCSGKEIVIYFARYGINSLFFVPAMFVLYYFIFKLFLSFGAIQKLNSMEEMNKKIFSKKTKIPNLMLFVVYLVFSSAMFAGFFELGQIIAGDFCGSAFVISTLIFAFIVLLKPFILLEKISSFLVPILIVLIFVTCIFGLAKLNDGIKIFNVPNLFLMFFSPVIYACQGLAISYFVIVKAGENLSKKEIKVSAFISSLVSCALQTLIVLILCFNTSLLTESMPLLSVSYSLGFPFDIIYFVILFIAILTTLFATSRSLYEIIGSKIGFSKRSALITLFFPLVLSFFGFDKILEYFYPIIGCIGFVLVICLLKQSSSSKIGFKFGNSKIHNSSKDT